MRTTRFYFVESFVCFPCASEHSWLADFHPENGDGSNAQLLLAEVSVILQTMMGDTWVAEGAAVAQIGAEGKA